MKNNQWKNIMKDRFVTAYQWLYGKTEKEALKVFKRAPIAYMRGVILAWERQCGLAFWED